MNGESAGGCVSGKIALPFSVIPDSTNSNSVIFTVVDACVRRRACVRVWILTYGAVCVSLDECRIMVDRWNNTVYLCQTSVEHLPYIITIQTLMQLSILYLFALYIWYCTQKPLSRIPMAHICMHRRQSTLRYSVMNGSMQLPKTQPLPCWMGIIVLPDSFIQPPNTQWRQKIELHSNAASGEEYYSTQIYVHYASQVSRKRSCYSIFFLNL